MSYPFNPSVINTFRKYSCVSGIIAYLTGLTVIAGWAFDITALKTIVGGFPSMKPNTAFCLVLLGSALFFYHYKHRFKAGKILFIAICTSVILIALTSIAEYAFAINLFIDELVFSDPSSAQFPGRMSIATTVIFSTIATALLLLLRKENDVLVTLSQILSLAALSVSLMALILYAFDAKMLFQMRAFNTLAIHTTLCFILLSKGVLLAESEKGMMALISSNTSGGTVIRRMMPVALLMLCAMAVFNLLAERKGYLEVEHGIAFSLLATMILFFIFFYFSARQMAKDDVLRQTALQETQLYKDIVNNVPIGIAAFRLENLDDVRSLKIIISNPANEKITGVVPARVLGKYLAAVTPEIFENGQAEDYREVVLTGKPRELGVRYFPGNEVVPENYFEITAFPLPDNAVGLTLENISARLRAEEEMKQANVFLNSILENIPNMIFVKDAAELRFVRFNKAGEELLGYLRSELIGKNDYDFFPKAEADFFTAKDRQVLKEGKLVDISEEPIHTRLKGTRWLHTKKIPVLDEHGNPLYMLGISDDITEKKLAEEKLEIQQKELHQYKKFFDLSFDLVCIANTQGYFKTISPSFSKVLGYSGQELVTKQFLDFIHPDDIPATLREMEKLKAGGTTLDFVNRYRCRDGTYRYFQWVSSPDPDTGELFAIARDITELKKNEEKITRLNKDLEQAKAELEIKVQQRTAELENANTGLTVTLDKLQRSNKRLEEFAYMASHDLRAPVTNLTALVDLHEKQASSSNPIFEKISFTANHLNAIVRDLTDLVALEKPVVDKKLIRFDELLATIQATIENQITESNAFISNDFLNAPSIIYPQSHLQSILLNLLTNALKYRSPDRSPEIKIKTEKKGGFISLIVEDNGIGIDLHKHEKKIFMAFQRVGHSVDGKGLGLYIVKRQAELFGGKVEVESRLGEGTRFTIFLKDDPSD